MRTPSRILIGLTGIVFALLGLRAFQLQVFGYSRYSDLAEKNRVKMVSKHAPRGRILSRDGEVLAESRPGYSISVLPYEIGNVDTLARVLSPVLNKDVQTLKMKMAEAKKRPLITQRIARDVNIEVVSWVEEHKLDLPGVAVEVEPIRKYPFGDILCHLIGYVGEISPQKLRSLSERGYRYGDMIGETGLEAQYEYYLRGREGVEFVEVDARGREIGPFPDRKAVAAEPGSDIYLTIDSKLQLLAEEALSNYERGCVFALDPRSGEVLVSYSKPGFDPNLLAVGISKDAWKNLISRQASPMWDRVTKGGYPPGSIYKIVTAASALETRTAGRWTRFAPCVGYFKYGDRTFKCWSKHGKLTIVPAISQSCDVFFYQIGAALGVERLAEAGLDLGFGRKTGLDIPDESSGLVPTRKWYNGHYGRGGWSKGVALNLAIGQGEILCTPVQVCRAIASVASGGVRCRPYVVTKVIGHRGAELYRAEVENARVALSDSTIQILREGMYGVVNGPDGTGRLARSLQFKIAGKTGTAENPPREDHSLFVGFAPFDSPIICLVVVVENAGHGGSVAAPLAGRLIEAYLASKPKGAT